MQEQGYLFGLDLGQANDYTAAAIVRRLQSVELYTEQDLQREGELWPQSATYAAFKMGKPKSRTSHYQCVHLQRWPVGTKYPAIVADVAEMLRRLPAPQQPDERQGPTRLSERGIKPIPPMGSRNRNELVIDRTGVGRAVYDMFTDLGVRPVGITITGGERAARAQGGCTVPKKDLAGSLQATFGTGRLKIAEVLQEAPTLVQELQNFEVRVSTSGHAQYAADWRSGDHDDLVLALAVAVWYGERSKLSDAASFTPVYG